ncbi:MAG: SprT-like domain-containing protein [Pseudomonadota bacterium]
MKRQTVNPHSELYSQLQKATEIFNDKLFGGELNLVVLTLQRGKNTAGYFSPDQWSNTHGKLASEIAINPTYLANQSLLVLFQTLVHELCHLWQHQRGLSHPRSGYHNQEWAEKMMEVGLIPSNTGKPGGKRVGQRMADYPAPSGKFIKVSNELVKSGFGLKWVDRDFKSREISCRTIPVEVEDELNRPLLDSFPELAPLTKNGRELKRKIKYCCPECGAKVWGKSGLSIICEGCNLKLLSEASEAWHTV